VPKIPIQISAHLKVDDRNVLARSTDTKPNAADRVDERIGLLTVDLAAHAPDIDVDRQRRSSRKSPLFEVKLTRTELAHSPGPAALIGPNAPIVRPLFAPSARLGADVDHY
jgi:hypothetical protein